VALADKLKAQAAPEDALFIFARAAEGPPMPLAVVRKHVRDLPVEVVLDDSMAMMPELKLSTFERIVIGARVSKSGRPTPSPGDLQGLSGPLAPRQNEGPYEVIVDQRVGEGG
jgi:cytochrome c-type biogenesis protein CcmH